MNLNMDRIIYLKGEIVWRHQTGTRHEKAAEREFTFTEKEIRQFGMCPFHLTDFHGIGIKYFSVALDFHGNRCVRGNWSPGKMQAWTKRRRTFI